MRRSSGVPTAVTVLAMLTLLVTLGSPVPRAHKAITSKYTYNEHVFPILRDRCGRCHFPGGPTPMSLMTYKEAAPWAESIREQLITQAMPPWYADPLARDVKGGHPIPPKELDVLVTWAVGGAPEGDDAKAPAPQAMRAGWEAGPPDAQFYSSLRERASGWAITGIFWIPTVRERASISSAQERARPAEAGRRHMNAQQPAGTYAR